MAETEKKVAAEAAAEPKAAAKKPAAKKPAAKKAAPKTEAAEKKPAANKAAPKADAAEKKPAAKKPAAKKAPVKKAAAETLSIKLIKSLSGRSEKQIATAKSLGLKKIGDVTAQPDNAQTQGKIAKIAHMVAVTKA